MNLAVLVSMALGVVIPLFNGLVTKYAAVKVRVFLQIILTAVAGFLTELTVAGDDFNLNVALTAWVSTLITALAVEAKIWAPLGVSDKLKSIGSSVPTTTYDRAA